jgi:inosine-uridine nucleoside N-ribohydrolase
MSKKILLDTDIGTDIDDAICLLYLLANPECELLGITTATGESEKRAMLASSLCNLVGKDIPIFPGTENPFIIEQQQKLAAQANSLNKWKHKDIFPKGGAIEFLRKTIRNNPGEITLLTIGPLTNIGLLFKVDEEIPCMLNSLVMMCGYFEHKVKGRDLLEWNAKGDYHASDIVYKANVAIHRSIGIDVTSQVTMDSEEFKERFSLDIFKPLQDYVQHWYEYSQTITFHDPLAAATIFNDDICKYSRGIINIELNDHTKLGMTNWSKDQNGKHEIASSVDKAKFFEEYFPAFKNYK